MKRKKPFWKFQSWHRFSCWERGKCLMVSVVSAGGNRDVSRMMCRVLQASLINNRWRVLWCEIKAENRNMESGSRPAHWSCFVGIKVDHDALGSTASLSSHLRNPETRTQKQDKLSVNLWPVLEIVFGFSLTLEIVSRPTACKNARASCQKSLFFHIFS